jgi:hypothetical protein
MMLPRACDHRTRIDDGTLNLIPDRATLFTQRGYDPNGY